MSILARVASVAVVVVAVGIAATGHVDGPPSPGANERLGMRMAAADGWPRAQRHCLDRLWTRESEWQARVRNYQGSGAYGIPQAKPASRMAAAGPDWRTDPATQIRWGLMYIRSRYGSPCGAWEHEQTSGWY